MINKTITKFFKRVWISIWTISIGMPAILWMLLLDIWVYGGGDNAKWSDPFTDFTDL